MNRINYGDINRVQPKPLELSNRKSDIIASNDFDTVLKNAVNNYQDIKFSKHAQTRMMQRKISLTQPEMEKIGEAVSRANSKGIRDSLVLLDRVALIVNIPSKTIVTTVDEKSIKESVFTNIDGAVIL